MIALRRVRLSDAPRLAEIYRPYVVSTRVTLEYDPPSPEEFASRISETDGEFPYIVCEKDGVVIGYAYAHRYRPRFGYRFCAELSVYVELEHRAGGVGSLLYSRLIGLLGKMGYRNLYGIVVDPNPASFALHRSFGFVEAGRDRLAAYKLGEWHDIVCFELILDDSPDPIPERQCPFRFDELALGESLV